MRPVGVCVRPCSLGAVSSAPPNRLVVLAAADPAAEAPLLSGAQASDAALPAAIAARPQSEEAPAPIAPPEQTLFAVIDRVADDDRLRQERPDRQLEDLLGARRLPTPAGTFTPHYTWRRHYSKQYSLLAMPYSCFSRGRGGARDPGSRQSSAAPLRTVACVPTRRTQKSFMTSCRSTACR